MAVPNQSRRDFVKRGAYVAPAVLTLAATPQFAKAGSGKPGKDDGRPGNGKGSGKKP